jgi:hypothetical protein
MLLAELVRVANPGCLPYCKRYRRMDALIFTALRAFPRMPIGVTDSVANNTAISRLQFLQPRGPFHTA